jgi:hypothetical protein
MNILLENDLHEAKKEFKVTDLQSATWVLRKLRALNKKADEINAVAVEEITRINEWAEKEVKALNSDKAYFEGLLTAYYLEERAKDKKFKLSTPFGGLTTRKSKKYIYEDEQAIIDYCNTNEIDVIRVKEELDKASFKQLCKDGVNQETGEIVPGVRVETVENISIKVE